MQLRAVACALSLAIIFGNSASARPTDADCPLVHPHNSALKLIGATLDQDRPGIPWQPEADREEKQPDGLIYVITSYASFQILRDQVLICIYGEIRSRQEIRIDHSTDIRLPMPGILMRCEGILRETPGIEPNDWKRRWCTHDPDE